MTRVSTTWGSSVRFGPGRKAYPMPTRVSSAAAGSPVRSATQRTATITTTAARTSTSSVSGLTHPILPDAVAGGERLGSGVDDDRDDHRAAPVPAVRPLADGPGDQLLELD